MPRRFFDSGLRNAVLKGAVDFLKFKKWLPVRGVDGGVAPVKNVVRVGLIYPAVAGCCCCWLAVAAAATAAAAKWRVEGSSWLLKFQEMASRAGGGVL